MIRLADTSHIMCTSLWGEFFKPFIWYRANFTHIKNSKKGRKIPSECAKKKRKTHVARYVQLRNIDNVVQTYVAMFGSKTKLNKDFIAPL